VRAPRRRDPLALLAAVAGIAAPAVAMHAHALAAAVARLVPYVRLAGPAATAAIIAFLAAAAAAGWLRRRHVAALLASREIRALVPADTHDPSMDEVARFAAQLARTRRRGRARLERPAAAIRLRIHSTAGGRLSYELHAPAQARGVLAAALGAYPDIELRDPVAVHLADDRTGKR
jgi:hypothetical protein